MNTIDIHFDFRADSKCGDPDTDSEKLYKAHKLLWNRKLPCGEKFNFEIIEVTYGRLLLKNNLCENLSSDRMCPHFVGKYKGKFDGWLVNAESEEFKSKVRTIGGHIVYPAHKKNGFTINQARGVNRKISDRFDLTLECIRRYYLGLHSPLYTTLLRYKNFFDLFVDFNGYISFFMLEDFIDKYDKIKFSLPFDDFKRSPLPESAEEYRKYKDNTIALINKRNHRIINFYK